MKDLQTLEDEAIGERDDQPKVPSEEIHIRNFDVSRAYDLTVRVRDAEGIVFANRYYLGPGETDNELDRIPPGEYQIIAELDSRRRVVTTCELGPEPAQTALVEIGNGTASVTQGLY